MFIAQRSIHYSRWHQRLYIYIYIYILRYITSKVMMRWMGFQLAGKGKGKGSDRMRGCCYTVLDLDGKSFFVDFMTLIADGDARAILISIAIHSCYQIRLRSKAVEQFWTCDEVQPCKYNGARFQHLQDTLHRCCTLPLLCPFKV